MTSLDPFFDSYYRLRPVNATFTGVHDFDDRWPDWSPEGLAAAADAMRSLRASLASPADSTPDLRDVQARDRALAVSFLDVQLAELESLHFQRGNPSLAIGEAAFGIIGLITRPFAPASERLESVIRRLETLPAFLEGAQRAISDGVPDDWRIKALKECDGAERVVGDGLKRWLALESMTDARVGPAAARAGAALAAFRRWLERDVPVASDTRYSAGPDFLDLLIAKGHWCPTDRRELGRLARAALDESLAALDRRARTAAPGGWPEVQSSPGRRASRRRAAI